MMLLRPAAAIALLSALALAAPAPPELDASALQSEMDLSLRWLRAQQDAEDGGYGGVANTALTLLAFADGPRAYRPVDGPFVARAVDYLLARADDQGVIGDAGATAAERRNQNTLAVAALLALEVTDLPTPVAEVVERTRSLAGEAMLARAPRHPTADEARAVAERVLGARRPDGSWAGEDGDATRATARALLGLAAAHAALKGGEAPEPTRRASPLPSFSEADRARVEEALERGVRFLASASPEGRWGALGRPDPGITAMVLGALLAAPEPRGEAAEQAIAAGLDWLASLQQPDGSIHDGRLANYVTSAAVLAFQRAGRPGDAERCAAARRFLQELQADGGEGYDSSHHYYGGVGYGGDERPDLSNLQMALEALAATGLEAGDPTFQKALTFLERSQNRSESNDLALEVDGARIGSGDDGGGVYAPGTSKAGFVTLGDGTKVPRSYGSMTYALLKGYLFAGLSKDDPRVEAAWKWIRANYTLDVNPGFEASSDPAAPYQGLYYYFYTMARALDLYGEERIVDSAGGEHDWRGELAGRVVAMQRPDGSWVNDNSPRWWEGNPVLATAYAMLTLDAALPEAAATAPASVPR